MSEDVKKRDRALQRRVRERQAKTGESYQAAWRQLTGDEEAPEEPEGLKETAASSNEASSHEDAAPPPMNLRVVLPLTHGPWVPPHQQTRVAARAKEAIDIERILISSAGTMGGPADWIVNDIEVDGRSQLTMKNLSGALFGTRGIAANRKATTRFRIEGFDPVERGGELAVTVTYIGLNENGCPFFASAVGASPPQRQTIVPIGSKITVAPMTKATITARVQNAPFQVLRLEINDADTACGAADWIVEDLRINARTQFAQPGPIPGDMFSIGAIASFVRLETCEAGSSIEIDVIYIGLNEHGARFTARLEGTVVRDDYTVAPPDLHVIVATAGQGPGDEVIATCNWRASTTGAVDSQPL
jgi:hypothetical protein